MTTSVHVHHRRADAHSCTARITSDVQLCGRGYACRTVVHSNSFAMHSSTNCLAGSGLTFEIMYFGSNTCRIFNHHLPERGAQQPQDPLEQMGNPSSRQEPGPTSRATPEALYSGTASVCMFSPRIRTGITSEPNLQITSLDFTRNLLLKKVSP